MEMVLSASVEERAHPTVREQCIRGSTELKEPFLHASCFVGVRGT